MHSKASYATASGLKESIRAARGEQKSQLVVRNIHWLDVFTGVFRQGSIAVHNGFIVGVVADEMAPDASGPYEGEVTVDGAGAYLVPGFIDSHVHIESSLMTPLRFQQAVLPCGTTAVIWDPHEIANVKGKSGIRWALDASEGLDLDVFVMVPSCVPSTTPAMGLETSGATLFAEDLREFVDHPRILGLAEMMNFPGLLFGDDDVTAKLLMYGKKRLDGHCPGLTGKDLNAYGVAGIHSCHESTSLGEAAEKLSKGIHVLIREGSCAKDADRLLPLINAYTSATVGLCSDDRNPADIAEGGHISCIIEKSLRLGQKPEDIFRAASWAPARMYGLRDRGAIAPGYRADFCLVAPKGHQSRSAGARVAAWTEGFEVKAVYKSGRQVDAEGLRRVTSTAGDKARDLLTQGKNLNLPLPTSQTFLVPARPGSQKSVKVRVIGVRPGQILTDHLQAECASDGLEILANPPMDILKISVLERHHGTGQVMTAFVKGFGLKSGAIATSINHDSHNVIVVGTTDELMARAVNNLCEIDGGIVVVAADGSSEALPLAIGGLMTNDEPAAVTEKLRGLKKLAEQCGCVLDEPFLQLSFLALPVIPALKITDKGLVDVSEFKIVSVQL